MLTDRHFPYSSMQEINLDWILTKVKNILRFVPDDGAVGQILRRTAHGAEWSDEQGAGGSVTSVNGMQGAVVLDASDVGALPDTTVIPSDTSDLTNTAGFVDAAGAAAAAPVQSVNGQTGAVSLTIPTDTADLTNTAGFVNASGAAAAAPVQSVNGQTGAVVLTIPSILSKAINSTTDGTGDIDIQLDPTLYMPIGFIKASPLNTFFVYSFGQSSNGQKWWMKLFNDSAGNLANTSVSGTLYYIEV